jgi:hypothetical protein
LVRDEKANKESSPLRSLGRWYESVFRDGLGNPILKSRFAKRCSRMVGGLIISLRRDLFLRAIKAKVPLNLPISLGGCGIPDKKGRLCLPHGKQGYVIRAKVSYLLNHPGRERGPLLKHLRRVSALDAKEATLFPSKWNKHYRLPKSELSRSTYSYEAEASPFREGAKRMFLIQNILSTSVVDGEVVAGPDSVAKKRMRAQWRAARPTSLRRWVRSTFPGSMRREIPRYVRSCHKDLLPVIRSLTDSLGEYVQPYNSGVALAARGRAAGAAPS